MSNGKLRHFRNMNNSVATRSFQSRYSPVKVSKTEVFPYLLKHRLDHLGVFLGDDMAFELEGHGQLFPHLKGLLQ